AIPLIVFHGDSDSTVHSINADQLIRQWVDAAGLETEGETPPRPTVQQGQAAGGRSYTRASYPDVRGQTFVEQWTVHGAGHAWSGGSREGSFADPNGPDATRELVRFFLEHPRETSAVPPVGSRESDSPASASASSLNGRSQEGRE
ncbi:MAG: hypothetical protein QOE66_315, partial [Chloroflexota bacterium]|nr:hypothetical protein [Chloroflexota bacterium]